MKHASPTILTETPVEAVRRILAVPRLSHSVDAFWMDDRVTIEFGQMYDRPEVTDEQLAQLVELFGARSASLSPGSELEGCVTCDYGSRYCTDIDVVGCTRHVDAEIKIPRK